MQMSSRVMMKVLVPPVAGVPRGAVALEELAYVVHGWWKVLRARTPVHPAAPSEGRLSCSS
jgi:hypothetical protein